MGAAILGFPKKLLFGILKKAVDKMNFLHNFKCNFQQFYRMWDGGRGWWLVAGVGACDKSCGNIAGERGGGI